MGLSKSIICCPKCKRPVEAKDYMDPGFLGALDSILPKLRCNCGYSGLPISLSAKDYEKWINK